jgi:hypothetical protein
MEKIKLRCVEELITIYPNHFNIKIIKILNGGWANFSSYQCKNCGQIFVSKTLKENYSFPKYRDVLCPNCRINLNNNLIKYPEQILINDRVILTKINMDYLSDIENSKILEFYLLPE